MKNALHFIKQDTAIRLKVCGSSIDQQTSIPLNGAMYPAFLPYFYQFEYPIEYALYEIKDDIQYVQSLDNVYKTKFAKGNQKEKNN